MHTISPAEARALADDASEAVRALNHATHPADWCPGLLAPADAHHVLGALHELAYRLPQLFAQISAFLQRLLQHDVITIDDAEHRGDPLAAIGTASHQLEGRATEAARHLASALDAAQQAVAFASYTSEPVRDNR
ncbi:MAG TPA: hypothetical protein VE441_01540 [Mycobacterium sp.]|jgi:hypothetical protein|nr:hypothetical protein [Mycobacterium sp.]